MPSSYVLGSHFEKFVRKQVKTGRYASASEVVRDALRLMEERETARWRTIEDARDMIRAGMESGEGIPAAEVFGRLRSKYRKLAAGMAAEASPVRRRR